MADTTKDPIPTPPQPAALSEVPERAQPLDDKGPGDPGQTFIRHLVMAAATSALAQYPIGFRARCIIADNWSNQNVYIPDAQTWVPPYTIGYRVLISPTEMARADLTTTGRGVAQAAVITTEVCVLLWCEKVVLSVPASVAPNATAASASFNLAQYGGTATTLGQKAMASSIPVTIASDQSVIPLAANILDGRQAFTATTGATTLITVPAGRVWVGVIGANCAAQVAAASATAGEATAIFTTTGVGVTPAAGTVFGVHCLVAANVAAGLVGTDGSEASSTPFVIIAPVGNTVTIAVASTNTGTSSVVDAWAIGLLQ